MYNGKRVGADVVIPPRRDYIISIIGLGQLGSAIADQLTGCDVVGWDPVMCGNSDIKSDTLYDSIKDANTIFIVVPSNCFEGVVREIIMEYADHKRWHDATKVNIISFTKGFCNGRLPVEVLQRELPFNPVGVISGPMLSAELYQERTNAMLASCNMNHFTVSEINSKMDNIQLYHTTDTVGVTLCGIMKNVYAVGMGMLAGSGYGENMKACLATRALHEMEYFAGCTISTYAGVGDFLTTCYSSKSRNYTYGYNQVTSGNVDGLMAEGVKNLDGLKQYSPISLPLVNAIDESLRTSSATPLLDALQKYNGLDLL